MRHAATSLCLLVLGAACHEPLVAELRPSIGRPGAARLEGRLLEVDDDEAEGEDDPTVPLEAVGDDGPAGRPYTLVIAGRCKRRGLTRADGELAEEVPARCEAPAGRRRTVLRVLGRTVGTGTFTVLPADRPALVVTSDVDMTYLETHFHGAGEIATLLRMPAKRHTPLPGMPALYRRLRGRADALRFVSGSPTFFRRHLQARLRIDRITADELTLKELDAIVGKRWSQPRRLEAALREQVGYKVGALLEGRLRLPPVTREVLLGDDTEMDAYAYTLYRDAVAGVLSADRLAATLTTLGVDEERRAAIAELLPRVRAFVRPGSGVVLIGIRETDRPNRVHPARRVAGPGLVLHRDTAALAAALAAIHVL